MDRARCLEGKGNSEEGKGKRERREEVQRCDARTCSNSASAMICSRCVVLSSLSLSLSLSSFRNYTGFYLAGCTMLIRLCCGSMRDTKHSHVYVYKFHLIGHV